MTVGTMPSNNLTLQFPNHFSQIVFIKTQNSFTVIDTVRNLLIANQVIHFGFPNFSLANNK